MVQPKHLLLNKPFRRCFSIFLDARKRKMASPVIQKQKFDYFLVLDFEATCDDKVDPKPQEIIEFPVLKVNGTSFETETIFHQYVQPRVHKEITPFCTELTGIIQDMVDDQPYLEDTLGKFHQWMLENGLLEPNTKSAFVTCGDWDLKTMLPNQCEHFLIRPEPYFNSWINIKKIYSNTLKTWPKGNLPQMLKGLGLPHIGRHHSGIDDCKNIANILKELAKKGVVFHKTGSV